MKKYISLILIFTTLITQLIFLNSCSQGGKTKYSEYYFDYFDTVTTVTAYTHSEEEFQNICKIIKKELYDYHRLYDIYYRYEGINNICVINDLSDGSHKEIKVDKKIIDLLLYSKEMYELTNGRINVAMGSVLSIWHDFRSRGLSDPSLAELPKIEKLKKANEHTDINCVIIDEENSTVFISDPEATLDVGSIAKGYAVERVADYLEEKGITDVLLNVGGNVRTVGMGKLGEPWKVAIENPVLEKQEEIPHIEYLNLSDMSLVTSGSYQRFYEVDGKRYHHIIDSETLLPGDKYLSVSVITEDSALGDALSTALFLMDIKEGTKLVDSLENVEAMWVLKDGKQMYSKNFKSFTFQ